MIRHNPAQPDITPSQLITRRSTPAGRAAAGVVGLRIAVAPVTLTPVGNVKNRRRGASTISSKNQITIPAEALRNAGLEAGERVVAHADGAGRVILEREHDVVAEFAGALTGTYELNELDDLRSEWD